MYTIMAASFVCVECNSFTEANSRKSIGFQNSDNAVTWQQTHIFRTFTWTAQMFSFLLLESWIFWKSKGQDGNKGTCSCFVPSKKNKINQIKLIVGVLLFFISVAVSMISEVFWENTWSLSKQFIKYFTTSWNIVN